MAGRPRIAVMSDLHIEFDRAGAERHHLPHDPPRPDGDPRFGPSLQALRGEADAVILAGDIDIAAAAAYAGEVAAALELPVILVAGNHEFYDGEVAAVRAALRRRAADLEHVHFLDETVVTLDLTGTAVRFLGTTLWSDFALFGAERRQADMAAAARMISDFHLISHAGGRRFLPEDAAAQHQRSLAWLRRELARPFAGTTVVVTHHAPSFRSVPARYANDPTSTAFASWLEDLVAGSGAALWVHGHMHESFRYRISETEVLCNPRGYMPADTNPDFRVDLVVEV